MPRKKSARRSRRTGEGADPSSDERVRVELDLPHELLRPSTVPVLRQIEAFLHEQQVEEQGNLLARSAELLDELGNAGFGRVDHWEVDPAGWLPLPEATHAGRFEPVEHLLRALRSPSWAVFAHAQGFAARLSSEDGRRADVHLRWVHREREHSIVLDLWGRPTATELRAILLRLRRRLSPLKVRLHR